MLGADTIELDTIPFTVQRRRTTVTFTVGEAGDDDRVSSRRRMRFRTAVRGSVPTRQPGSALLIDLPRELRSVEADTLDDLRHLAYGYKRAAARRREHCVLEARHA